MAMNLLSTYVMMMHNIVKSTKCHQTVHVLMAKTVNFMLHVIYYPLSK